MLDVRCSKPSKLISALLIKTRQTQTYNCRLEIADKGLHLHYIKRRTGVV